MSYMPPSPKGRLIQTVEGDPDAISERGLDIYSLGNQMITASEVLEELESGSINDGVQQGEAIKQLQEQVGDSWKKLREAGELYKPVGPRVKAYGDSLATCQPMINLYSGQCDERWAKYISLPGDKDGSTTPEADGGFLGMGGHDADSPEAKEEAAENEAKAQAYEEWQESATSFDSWYDDWEDAFEEASNGMESDMDGEIKDSFWDAIGDVLSVVAIVLGVVAFFVGGWVIAAIALAVSVIYLAVIIIQYNLGEKGKMDIFAAALGVLPVGKLSNLTKFSHGAVGLKAGLRGLGGEAGKLLPGGSALAEGAFKFKGWGDAFRTMATGSGANALRSARTGYVNFYREAGVEITESIMKKSDLTAKIDVGLAFASNLGGWSGRLGAVGGPDVIGNLPFGIGAQFGNVVG